MSVQAMAWALSQQVVTESHARHVLLCLANYADQAGRAAFPSVASLSVDTGLAPRTIQYRLRELEEGGLIKRGNQAVAAAYITQRDRVPVCYDLALERGAQDAPRVERGARHDATGCTPEQNGVHATTERGAQRAPNPPFNHPLPILNQKEGADALSDGAASPAKQAKKTRPAKFDPLTAKPENVTKKPWEDFCEMRRVKGKPMTPRVCELIAQKLSGLADPDAVLDKSTVNCWTDVYPDSVLPRVAAGVGKPSGFRDLPVHTSDMYPEVADGQPQF